MNERALNRRDFLKKAAVVSGSVAAAGLTVTACEESFAIGPPAPGTTRIRKDVSTLPPNDPIIQAYKEGVRVMKQRVQSDGTSWIGQARIHLDTCPHGNWFFLPWHRAYLSYFEKICREASGDADFSLPYWDWTKDRSIPAAFWGNSTNPLFDGTRLATPTSRTEDGSVGPRVIEDILQIPDFITFGSARSSSLRPGVASGQLEGQPHNHIHNFVNGNMWTYMSPLDPIFWLHHANVDRLWTEWVARHPSATPSNPDWLSFDLKFRDTQGNPAQMKVSELLRTEDLGYRYDTQPSVPAGSLRMTRVVSRAPIDLRMEISSDLEVGLDAPLSVNIPQKEALSKKVLDVISADGPRNTCLRLAIEGVRRPEEFSAITRVFLNCPEPNQETSVESPYFVGSFSFFGHSSGDTFYFDAANAIRRLRQDSLYGAEGALKLSLVSVGYEKAPEVKEMLRPNMYSL